MNSRNSHPLRQQQSQSIFVPITFAPIAVTSNGSQGRPISSLRPDSHAPRDLNPTNPSRLDGRDSRADDVQTIPPRSLTDNSAGSTRHHKSLPPQLHFAKWWKTTPAQSRLDASGERSGSLSPRPTEPLVQPTHRPPTPQGHRGILKSLRRHTLSDSTDSTVAAFAGRSFQDCPDLAARLNGEDGRAVTTYAAIPPPRNTPSLADSLPRKTVRFADGKFPTINGCSGVEDCQAPLSGVRNQLRPPIPPIPATTNRPTPRHAGHTAKGIYEWGLEENLSRQPGGQSQLSRPPNRRSDEHHITEWVDFSQTRQRLVKTSNGNLAASPMPSSPGLPSPQIHWEASDTNFDAEEGDEDSSCSYANLTTINQSRGESVNINITPRGATYASVITARAPTPTRLYRTELRHDSSEGGGGGALVGQQTHTTPPKDEPPSHPRLPSTTSPPLNTQRFVYSIKSTPASPMQSVSLSVDGRPTSQVSSGAFESASSSSLAASRSAPVPLKVFPEILRIPITVLPLHVDTTLTRSPETTPKPTPIDNDLQTSLTASPPLHSPLSFLPRHGAPLKAGLRRHVKKPHSQDPRRSGGLDRDGVWRPNRGSFGGFFHSSTPLSSPPAAQPPSVPPQIRPHTLTFPGDTPGDIEYIERLRRQQLQRQLQRQQLQRGLSSPEPRGYRVPIFVASAKPPGGGVGIFPRTLSSTSMDSRKV